MNKSIKYILVIILLAIMPSCVREVLEPEQMISGDYVPDDGSQLSDTYLHFEKGYVTEMVAYSKKTFAKNCFWGCCEYDFRNGKSNKYSIQNKELIVSGRNMGLISQKDDVLTLGEDKYISLKEFKDERYSRIALDKQALSYLPQTKTVEVTIVNPIVAGVLTASTNTSWISNMKVADNKTLSFTVSGTNVGRQGKITLSYTNALDCDVTVSQETSTHIILPSASGTVSYSKQTASIKYSIDNPIATSSLKVSCNRSWVKDITVGKDNISYSVDENTGKSIRTATFTLSYSGAADVTYTLTQKGDITTITTDPASASTSYTGGSASFIYSVENPKQGATMATKSEVDWITNVKLSGNTVSYTVTRNVSAAQREGKIILTYGSYASYSFAVSQRGAPVTSLTLNKSTLSLIVDGAETLVATIVPSDAKVLWTSSNKSVAIVSQNGRVSAVGGGTAIITASSEDGSKSASCTVTVEKRTPTFNISRTSLTLSVGTTDSISITSDSDCNFTASSDNPSVAAVSVSGRTVTVTGVSKGSATLTVNCPETARYKAGVSKKCAVLVKVVTDLSANGTANCYIVPRAGDYMFKATVKGGSTESVGTPSSAALLWESYGTSDKPSMNSIIATLNYSNGYVTFSTPETLKNGNAVIAVKNSSGTILWSWHIWVSKNFDPDMTAQVYNNKAGTMMDRNLGATSATKGDVEALGLLYQWGRKDPFLGSSSISSSTEAASTITWPSAVESKSSTGTIDYTVKNPTTYITYNSSNYDWYYTGSSSTDNTRWQTSKGVYDPCPPGWRVPDGGSNGVWATAFGTSSSWTRSSNWDSTNKGMNFGSTDKKLGSGTVWYPASGWRTGNGGSLGTVGYDGNYWSCSSNNGNFAYYLFLSEPGSVYPAYGIYRAHSFAVRCLKMK